MHDIHISSIERIYECVLTPRNMHILFMKKVLFDDDSKMIIAM